MTSIGLCANIQASASIHANANPKLKPFTTDGCSSFPDGTLSQPTLWRHCCVVHDIDYWMAGENSIRLNSNSALGICVNESLNHNYEFPFGLAMAIGTNLGGSQKLPTSWKWSYGWTGTKKKIDSKTIIAEKLQVQEKLEWAAAWLGSSEFAKEYKLTPKQQQYIMDGLKYKIEHPLTTGFLGVLNP